MNYLNVLSEINDFGIDIEELSRILDDMGIKYKLFQTEIIFVSNDDQIDEIINRLKEFEDYGVADFYQLFDSLEI